MTYFVTISVVRRRAFTLIELLVVIAIIAILAAILFPVFAQAREKARQTTCASNLRQASIGVLGYVQDFDETYPFANYPVTVGTNPLGPTLDRVHWYQAVEPYFKVGYNPLNSGKAQSVWTCPDYDKTANDKFGNNPAWSYSWNANLGPAQAPGTPLSWQQTPPKTLADVQFPTQTVLVSEGIGRRVYTYGNDTGTYPEGTFDKDVNIVYIVGRTRHNGGANFAFADGHVKWLKAPSPAYSNFTGSTDVDLIANIVPVQSNGPVVYKRSINPGATAWFRED